eukprot:m.8865 g.8865  ORF g.8865 m.8865 type:complete len:696 (+) comp3277_c0_seq1:196-2283(+)
MDEVNEMVQTTLGRMECLWKELQWDEDDIEERREKVMVFIKEFLGHLVHDEEKQVAQVKQTVSELEERVGKLRKELHVEEEIEQLNKTSALENNNSQLSHRYQHQNSTTSNPDCSIISSVNSSCVRDKDSNMNANNSDVSSHSHIFARRNNMAQDCSTTTSSSSSTTISDKSSRLSMLSTASSYLFSQPSESMNLVEYGDALGENLQALEEEKERRLLAFIDLENKLEDLPDTLKVPRNTSNATSSQGNLSLQFMEELQHILEERERELQSRKEKCMEIVESIKKLWLQLGLDESSTEKDILDEHIASNLSSTQFQYTLQNIDALESRRQTLLAHVDVIKMNIQRVMAQIHDLWNMLEVHDVERQAAINKIEMESEMWEHQQLIKHPHFANNNNALFGGECQYVLALYTQLREKLREERAKKLPEVIMKTYLELDIWWDKTFTCETVRKEALAQVDLSPPLQLQEISRISSTEEKETILECLHFLLEERKDDFSTMKSIYHAVETIENLQVQVDNVSEEELSRNRGGITLKVEKWKKAIGKMREEIVAWEESTGLQLLIRGIHFLHQMDLKEAEAKERVLEERQRRHALLKKQTQYESKFGSVPATPKRKTKNESTSRLGRMTGPRSSKRAKTRMPIQDRSNFPTFPNFETQIKNEIEVEDESSGNNQSLPPQSFLSYSNFQKIATDHLQSTFLQ